jgi:hypothetical protein
VSIILAPKDPAPNPRPSATASALDPESVTAASSASSASSASPRARKGVPGDGARLPGGIFFAAFKRVYSTKVCCCIAFSL